MARTTWTESVVKRPAGPQVHLEGVDHDRRRGEYRAEGGALGRPVKAGVDIGEAVKGHRAEEVEQHAYREEDKGRFLQG